MGDQIKQLSTEIPITTTELAGIVETAGQLGIEKGVNYVADGGAFELNITGTPTKLYDNGVDKTSSISSNKYSIPAVSEPHTIAVIF